MKVVVKEFQTTIKKRELEGKLPSKRFKVPLEMDNPLMKIYGIIDMVDNAILKQQLRAKKCIIMHHAIIYCVPSTRGILGA